MLAGRSFGPGRGFRRLDTLLARLLLLAGLPIVVSGLSGLLIYRFRVIPVVAQAAIDELDAANRIAGVLAEMWIDEQLRVVSYVASRPGARAWDVPRMLAEGRRIAGGFGDVVAVVFADRDGTVVVDTLQTGTGQGNVADRPFFHEALTEGRAVSDVLLARTSGRPIVTLASAVRDDSGAARGVAFSVVHPQLLYRIFSPALHPQVISSFIVDGNAVLVTGPEAGRPVGDDHLPGRASNESYVNLMGELVYGRSYPIDGTGWRIVTEMTVATVTESFDAYNGLLLGSLIGTLLVAAAVAALLAMTINRPLTRLAQLSNALSRGEPVHHDVARGMRRAPNELRNLRDRLVMMATTIQSRRAELIAANDLLEATQAIARVGSWEYCRDPRSVRCSAQLARMLGIGEEARSINPRTVLGASDARERARFLARFRASLASNEDGFEIEHGIVPLDGTPPIVVIHRIVHIRDDAGRVLCSRGTMLDITARHEMEASLREALADKSVLLQEVQHRVRNNLAVVEGILSLQRAQLPEESAAFGILTDSQSRVASMAILHRQLYETDHMAEIDLADYVEALAASLRESYGSPEVHLTADVAPETITVDVAFPCGLILNELIVNAYKHAFSDGRGSISITGRRLDATTYEISVADDGIGTPPSGPAGLGLELTTRLAGQLGGTIQMVRGEGTRAVVRFPLG